MKAIAEFHDYRLFQYERDLAVRELNQFGCSVVSCLDEGVEIRFDNDKTLEYLLARSTYFRAVRIDSAEHLTRAHHVEERHRSGRRAPRRQATRFLSHGLHEYRGKFNPQLAQSLLNIMGAEPETLVVDPFMGSGTTGVVALTLGMPFAGSDLNPLAVLMSQAKLDIARPAFAGRILKLLTSGTDRLMGAAQDKGPVTARWDAATNETLCAWFQGDTLREVANVLDQIDNEPRWAQTSLKVALSSVLRSVSLQDPRDLRIRRRRPDDLPSTLVEELPKALAKLRSSAQESVDARAYWHGDDSVSSLAELRSAADMLRGLKGRSVVVTSPPYAMGLPYVDTDRLSLLALRMTTASELRGLERLLTGNRELSKSDLNSLNEAATVNPSHLPDAVMSVIRQVRELHLDSRAGFRRVAIAALLYRYFTDLADVFEAIANNSSIESAVFVVGENTTTSMDGDALRIETPKLLSYLAESRGLTTDEIISLETWPRFDIHSANSIKVESAIVLSR